MSKSVLVIAGRESFMVRALVKKITDNGYNAIVVNDDVNSVSARWNEADAYTYYLETGQKVNLKLITYMQDTMATSGGQLILIGEKADAQLVSDNMSKTFILETFLRPLDTGKYMETLSDYLTSGRGGRIIKKTILIVDDDPTYMGLIRGWLKEYYNVLMATSATQAIQQLALNNVDLILLDYEMPIVDGSQVLEMLRADSNNSKIPVFFLTGKSDRDSVMKVLDLKPDNYLLKTIEREDLIMMLNNFFMGKK